MDIQSSVTGAAATTALAMMLINAIVQNWPEDRPRTFTTLLDTIWNWARKSSMSYMSTRMGATPTPTTQTTVTHTDTRTDTATIVPDPKVPKS